MLLSGECFVTDYLIKLICILDASYRSVASSVTDRNRRIGSTCRNNYGFLLESARSIFLSTVSHKFIHYTSGAGRYRIGQLDCQPHRGWLRVPAANKIVFHPFAGENFVPFSLALILFLSPSFRGVSSYIKARPRLSSSSNAAAAALPSTPLLSHSPEFTISIPHCSPWTTTLPNYPLLPPFRHPLNPILYTTHKLLYEALVAAS